MKKRVKMKFFLVVLALLLAGCNQGNNDKGNVLARFEGGVLTTEDVTAHYRKLKRESKYRQEPELLTPEFVFEHALNMEMIIAEGLRRELHHDPRIRQDLHGHMSELFLRIMEEELVPRLDREAISDEEARAYYEEHRESYEQPAYYQLRVFEIDPAQGDEVMAELGKGGLTFAEAAAAYALDEKERENGGITGRRTLRRFQPAWRPVVEKLAVGEPTGPVEIDGKSHVLLLESKSEPHKYSYEEKKEYIKNDALYQRYRDEWRRTYDRLRREFEVKINDERLNGFYREMAGDGGEG